MTGHQDLGAEGDASWVAIALAREIDGYRNWAGVTSLAVGADQLFASLLRERGIPYVVIVPCERYEETFHMAGDLERYRALLADASEVVRLPFVEADETAFWEAGKKVVLMADAIIAIWDGEPARGLGGTGDVVHYSLERGRRVIQLDPKTHRRTDIGHRAE